MTISIIIPIFNMAETLERCVESILNQECADYELILVDDGSTDNSFDICKRYAENHPNVIVHHQSNGGSGSARNVGISLSKGDYLLFLDSDDELLPGAIKTLKKEIIEKRFDLYVFGYYLVSKANKRTTKKYHFCEKSGQEIRLNYSAYFCNDFQYGIQGAPWNKLFNGNTIRKNKIEYPSLRRHQDEVFISRFMTYCGSVRFMGDILYTHFANDLRLIYQKYPANYLEVVNRLFDYRNEIVLTWNQSNSDVKALIVSEYINNLIRCCYRFFLKENGAKSKFKDRVPNYEWLKKEMREEAFSSSFKASKIGIAKKIQNFLFIHSLKKGHFWIADIIVKMRIRIAR